MTFFDVSVGAFRNEYVTPPIFCDTKLLLLDMLKKTVQIDDLRFVFYGFMMLLSISSKPKKL